MQCIPVSINEWRFVAYILVEGQLGGVFAFIHYGWPIIIRVVTLSAFSTLLWDETLIRFPCITRMSSYFVNKMKAPQDIYVHIMFCLWNVVFLFNNIFTHPSISLNESEFRMLNNSPSINMSMKMITRPIQSSVPKT